MPHWHFVDVDDSRIPTARNTAVRLDRTEYRPAMLAIARISRETERDEQRLECFRPVVLCTVSARRAWEKKRTSRTGACIVRHTVGTARRCDLISKNQRGCKKPYPAPLMYQSPGAPFNSFCTLSLGILKCAISGASPLRSAFKSKTKKDPFDRQTFWCRA